MKQGYTTTPEYWAVEGFSQNHCMMYHIEEWFFSCLGGIRNAGIAFRHVHIQPYLPSDLDSCHISTHSHYDLIRSAWQRTSQGIAYHITIPSGSEATVNAAAVRFSPYQ